MKWPIGGLFGKVDPARSQAKGWVQGCRCVSAPDEVVGGSGCQVGLSRLVAINGIGEYSLEIMINKSQSVLDAKYVRCGHPSQTPRFSQRFPSLCFS